MNKQKTSPSFLKKQHVFACGYALLMLTFFSQCKSEKKNSADVIVKNTITLEVENFDTANAITESLTVNDSTYLKLKSAGWLEYTMDVQTAGRYKVEFTGRNTDSVNQFVWIEDYARNTEGRTYNITGNVPVTNGISAIDGSPLDTGKHVIRIHADSGAMLDKVDFILIRTHVPTPQLLTQKMDGEKWELVWSDEFDGSGLPDTSKWLYDVGNWGWGNNELQYYTIGRTENARQENGNLIIEARKDDLGFAWTSARLTTRSKVSFTYGKIEFRARVPVGRGTWSAGWLLGDAYMDEKSWPLCGEIDVLEMVGFETEPETLNGLAHASIHCGAYYFKLNNQPTAITPVEDIHNTFHTYTLEWYPDSILIFIDNQKYFTYSDTSTPLSWPYNNPQNIIINLAMGGGWGGAKGMDSTLTRQSLILDYVRVYARL